MNNKADRRSPSINWNGPLRAMLIVAMLLPILTLGPRPSTTDAASRIQPMLLALAAKHPNIKVNVIVQKVAQDNGPEQMVAKLGGTITGSLHIINAFSAEMPAKAVPDLAKADGVRWVSMDSPVQESSGPVQFTTWATDVSVASTSSVSSFNSTAIRAGSYIWFNSVVTPSGLGSSPVTINFDESTIQFSANGAAYRVSVPNAAVTFSPSTGTATTTFNQVTNTWVTTARTGMKGNTFLVGVGYRVPVDLPGGINPITWSGRFVSDTPGVGVNWKWSAAVYSTFNNNYSALGVKPCDSNSGCGYANNDLAGTPESYKSYVVAGARGSGAPSYTGGYGPTSTAVVTAQFANSTAIVDSMLPNGTYGYGSSLVSAFSKFPYGQTPNYAITRVELALRSYVPAQLASGDVLAVSAAANGTWGASVNVNPSAFSCCSAQSASTVYVDITNTRTWRWADFGNNLQVRLDQSRFARGHNVYYDAVGLRVTSQPGTDTSRPTITSSSYLGPTDASKLSNVYNSVVRATDLWNAAPSYLQGQNMRVAVVDSGNFGTKDYSGRIVASVNFSPSYSTASDRYGHGTFVTGVIAGNGTLSSGMYMGIAPQADVITVRVSDDQGMGTESDVVKGLQWVNDNRATYNIKVVNISLNSSVAQSYHTSPLNAAVEILWFNGVTVVVSAGNNGTANLFPPANDPFVITVGATNDQGTAALTDDVVASYSAYGVDEAGVAKPDLVAPGSNIIAPLPDVGSLTISTQHPANQVNQYYFRMSGTSMAAPVVAGAALLLLQDEPNLTPDQVKYRLKATANRNTAAWPGYNPTTAGAGLLDAYAAVHGTTTLNANTGVRACQLLWTGSEPLTWNSVNWNSVNWNSVNWNSVNWNSVNWNSVNWSSDYWGR